MLEICSSIFLFAPVPSANMVMTALTPMIIPSMVRTERILFILKDRADIFIVEGMLTMILGPLYH